MRWGGVFRLWWRRGSLSGHATLQQGHVQGDLLPAPVERVAPPGGRAGTEASPGLLIGGSARAMTASAERSAMDAAGAPLGGFCPRAALGCIMHAWAWGPQQSRQCVVATSPRAWPRRGGLAIAPQRQARWVCTLVAGEQGHPISSVAALAVQYSAVPLYPTKTTHVLA